MIVVRDLAGADTAGPRGAARGAVVGVSLALGQGLHAVLGTPEDGTIALGDLLAGRRAPARGSVRLEGRDPHQDPALRRRIAHLSPLPELPEARDVAASVRGALAARGMPQPEAEAGRALASLGIGPLARRRLASLTHGEARAVDAAIALSAADPWLVVAHEPFVEVTGPVEARVEARLRELAQLGACVLLVTSSPRDASRLGDDVLVLERGIVVRGAAAGGAGLVESPPWPGARAMRAELVAHLAPRADHSAPSAARAVARLLADRDAAVSVTWDEPPPGVRAPSMIRVAGPDEAACAMAILDAVVEADVELVAMAPVPATLFEVRTATEQLRVAAAWYARAHAMPHPQAVTLGTAGSSLPTEAPSVDAAVHVAAVHVAAVDGGAVDGGAVHGGAVHGGAVHVAAVDGGAVEDSRGAASTPPGDAATDRGEEPR